MARPGITKNDVFDAANQLLGRGAEPTIEQVRGILGTGSNSTIAGFLREWRALHRQNEAPALTDDLPHEFVGLMKGLWQRLINQSDNKIATVEQQNAKMLEAANAELSTLAAQHRELQQQHEKLKQEKCTLQADKSALEQGLIKKDQAITSLTTQNEGLLAQITEKERYLGELARLHQQTQENLEHFREASREQRLQDQERYHQQLQQAESTIKQLHHDVTTATQEKINLTHQVQNLTYEKDSLRQSHDADKHKLEELQQVFGQLQKVHRESEHTAREAKNASEKVHKKLAEQQNLILDLHKQEALLSQRVSLLDEELRELKTQNKMLANEKWEIMQEKAQLEGQIQQLQVMVDTKPGSK